MYENEFESVIVDCAVHMTGVMLEYPQNFGEVLMKDGILPTIHEDL